MAFSTVPLVASSDSWTASQHNTYIRDNLSAIFVGTTNGDMDYYTSSSAKSRLAIGTAYSVLYSTGSVPAYGGLSTIAANSALLGSQAAGDLPYASSSTAVSRLALGAAHKFVKSEGGSAPLYGGLVYKRQGGSSTDWSTYGLTTYSPTSTLIQAGSISISITSNSGASSVTYPTAYTQRPLVFVSIYDSTIGSYSIGTYAESTTGMTIFAYNPLEATASVSAYWLAIGA